MEKATGDKPKMWGTAIIGFGNTLLKYDSGRELEWFKIGFSPRKANLTLYGIKNSAGQECWNLRYKEPARTPFSLTL